MIRVAPSYRRSPRQRGVVFIEAALLTPLAIAGFIGVTASNALYHSHRAVTWAVNQAVLANGLRPTPSMTSTRVQRQFRVRFFPDSDGGKFLWTLPNRIPTTSQECKQGQADIACGAWITMTTMGRIINSARGSSMLHRVDMSVTYDDIPVEAGIDTRLGRFRKVTVSAKVIFDGGRQTALRKVSGIGSLLPSFTVTRSESIG